MEQNRVSIDEFEKCLKQGEADYKSVLAVRLIMFVVVLAIVVFLLSIPKTFWLIPSNFTKEELNPYGEPVMIKFPKNIAATDLNKKEDYSRLIKIKSLQNGATYYILPLAQYSITARIKAKNKFFFNQSVFDKIALVDYGFVWGDMAKDEYFPKIYSYSREQLSGARELLTSFERKYYHQYRHKLEYLDVHSSHTHVIPANRKIRNALNAVRYGQTVKLEGYLVDVYDSNYFRFAMSSLSLEDSNDSSRGYKKGGGSCEIMYVNKVQVGNKVFK